jgi:hypothetical protein
VQQRRRGIVRTAREALAREHLSPELLEREGPTVTLIDNSELALADAMSELNP